jgi:hypothetical protein
MAGEVEHVIAPREESVLDLVRVADLQNVHLGVAVPAGRVDGIENGLQLQLQVQDRVLGLVLVGSADGDEDAERTPSSS